jgi:hypothetical protein
VTGPANDSQPAKRRPTYTGACLYSRDMGKLPFLALGLVGLAACGKVEGFADAAMAVDASDIDAPVDAIPFGPVTVDVRTQNGDGLPQIGATVVFVDTDGEMTRVAAGQDGRATAMVHPGASVTAIWLQSSGPRLVTILAVEPGDELKVGFPANPSEAPTGTSTITVPELTTPAEKYVYTACDSGSAFAGTGPVRTTWRARCDQADSDVLVVGADPRGNLNQYLYRGNVANAERTTIALTGEWRFIETFNIGFTDVPPATSYISAVRRLRSGSSELFRTSNGTDVSTATPSFAIDQAPMAGDDMEIDLTVNRTPSEEWAYGQSNVRLRLPVNPTLQVRLADFALPFVTSSGLDLTSRSVTWEQTEGGIAADAVVSDTYFSRDPGDASPQTFTTWRVIAPGGTTSLTLPTLPSELEELLPRSTDRTDRGTVVLLASSGHDYRAMRQLLDLDYISWVYGSGPAEPDVIAVSGAQQR